MYDDLMKKVNNDEPSESSGGVWQFGQYDFTTYDHRYNLCQPDREHQFSQEVRGSNSNGRRGKLRAKPARKTAG